ncbi:MAG TPA: LamG-like jellyroll fold domain-containing protein, partial [Vicinamibacterales bacterium]
MAYYALDQASGTSATDSSGNSYSGTLNGAAWTGGRVGSGALSFDNVNDRVVLPLDVPGAEGAAITVSAWVRPSTIADNGVIVAKDRSGFTQWTLKMDGRAANNRKNNLSFTVNAGGHVVSATSDNEVMADLQWHHVVGVYDGANVYVYMDGNNVDSTANPLTGTIANYAHQVCIGTSGPTCNESAFFGGLIDDVRIYSRGLTPAEVWDLFTYNGGVTTPPADTTAPAVTITAPAQSAVVSGSVAITAQASDDVGVAGVQFTLDGANLSAEDTTAPYGVTWNTTAVANGTHRIRASARDAAGNVTVTSDLTVTVQNVSDTTAPVISGLSATATATGASISWSTNEPADTQVEFGTTAAYGSQTALDSSLSASHAQTLSGLTPSTLYHYRVRSRDAAGNLGTSADATFTTASQMPAGALVYYAFDQSSGTSAIDSSGNNNNGTLVNGPAWTTGRIGSGALSFDNVNDRVVLPTDLAAAEGGAITVSAWVKPSTIADTAVIVAKDRSGFTQWSLKMDGRGGNNKQNNLSFTVNAGGHVVSATSDAEVMADLGWHHVVGVYDGAQVYIYMDGVNVDSTANPLTGTIANYSHQICVGTSGPTCNESAFFGGLIDEVRIYGRGLTASEVQSLMSGSASTGTLPVVTVAATDANASENGDTGAFTFSRTGDTTAALTVSYTVSGTATGGSDYTALSSTVTIPAGAASAAVGLTPMNDTIVETSESVIVSVSSTSSYQAGSPASATVMIADDDVSDTSVIIIDHNAVALYDKIPAIYLAEAKKMFLNVLGESDSRAYRNGLNYLAQQNAAYATSIRDGVAPEGPRTDALRFSNSHWGDVSNASGWGNWYGEEDWYTSDQAKTR